MFLFDMIAGPRGAVGGGSNGSRVDPWWNPGSFCPSVSSSPGPPPPTPRIDEGPPLDNNNSSQADFHFNNNNNNRYNNSNNANSRTPSTSYHRPDAGCPDGDPYGLISTTSSQQPDSGPPAGSRVIPDRQSPDSLNGLLSGHQHHHHHHQRNNNSSSSSLLSSLLTGNNHSSRVGSSKVKLEHPAIKLERYADQGAEEQRYPNSPADISSIDGMKFETAIEPNGPSVEPPHSSQGNNLAVQDSVVGVDSMLLSAWGATGTEFLEAHDPKQSAAGLADDWDTILLGGAGPGVVTSAQQTLTDLKPLPPFTGYTGHLSINGIPGHHYHTIASSAGQRGGPNNVVGNQSGTSPPSPTSNQEYYESSVVSSSTPCPQQQQHQQQKHQAVDYIINTKFEDLAEIIGSAMADTTVPASRNGGNNGAPDNNNGPGSADEWVDLEDWIGTDCSPKTNQDTTSSSPYSHMYSNPSGPQQAPPGQHGSSTLQSLLTHGYSPLLQQRLQQASCGGETPSSTSPYPPVSPPGRVSTSSCSPDEHHQQLHSSFVAPQHPRRRSRPSAGAGQPASKKSTTNLVGGYGSVSAGDSGLMGTGKEKPVHRCSICNRGFLNKSNIKVHLRTHTGEKPFRCEVCGKAFRQKAHLIKHQQIHKRIGRD